MTSTIFLGIGAAGVKGEQEIKVTNWPTGFNVTPTQDVTVDVDNWPIQYSVTGIVGVNGGTIPVDTRSKYTHHS